MKEEEIAPMRMFDTELFNQEWFGELSPRLKLLYIYALMKCDCAGVLELNLRRFTFDLNCPNEPVTKDDLFKAFGSRIVPLGADNSGFENCTKALIPDFIRFHYGNRLVNDRKHYLHRAVVKKIKSYGLTLEYIANLAIKKFEFDDFSDVIAEDEPKQKQGELFPVSEVSHDTKPKKKTEKKAAFTPPTLEEVKAYFKEVGTDIDPEEFWAKYESVGWVDKNKNRIKDWRRCLVTWEKFRKRSSASPSRPMKSADNWRGANSKQIEEAASVL